MTVRPNIGDLVEVEPYRWGNPLHWHDIRLDQPVYKYVDLDHADSVARGSVKIGTLWGYRELEGKRKDTGENTIPIEFLESDVLDLRNPQHRVLLRAMGLEIPDDFEDFTIVTNGAAINIVGQDFFTSCFSKAPDNICLLEERRQAIFEIADLKSWVRRVCHLYPVLGPARAAEVRYQDRANVNLVGGRMQPSPFIKPHQYIDEQEVRVIWFVNENTPMGRLPFLNPSPPDEVIANLTQRVA